MAIIIGVIHICFGIILKGVNALFFNEGLDFGFEFVPQIVFMCCTFGYMVFMIIFKWLNVYDPEDAPSIINTMINMVLTPFRVVSAREHLVFSR